MELMNQAINRISAVDEVAELKAKTRVNGLAKPQGSMGMLEAYYVQLCAITGEDYPELKSRAIVAMCADHGIAEEGIVTGLQRVTLAQAKNMVRGVTGVCALAKQAGAAVIPVDVGILTETGDPGIRDEKVRYGTANFTKGPAMSREEAVQSIEAGIRTAWDLIDSGVQILGTGEMGIGNTTPSSAMLSVFTGKDPQEVTGIGANLPLDKLPKKIEVIRKGIALNRPNPEDPLDVLSKVGGLEIGGMAGVMLGAASRKTPVIVDGFISSVSALLAVKLCPEVRSYLIGSHQSMEKAAALATEMVGIHAPLDLEMRLGEGTGAALMFNILEAAVFMAREMATYEDAGIAVI